MEWLKKNKWKVIAPVFVVIVLAVAFWLGGGAPGMQGWTVERESAASQEPLEPSQNRPEDSAQADNLETAPVESETPSEEEDTQEEVDVSAEPSPESSETPVSSPNGQEEAKPVPEATNTVPPGDKEYSEAQGMEINPATGQDRYQTDPVPEGKPLPVEPQDTVITDTAYTCTLSISCATILDHMDWLDSEKVELVPEDGWILQPMQVTFYEGESVFNVLQRTCKQQKIHMEFSNTPIYNSAYIEGIHNLYEKDCGELSGWMYKVNEWFPNYGVSRYQLQDGDVICFVYTCELGVDVGGHFAVGS